MFASKSKYIIAIVLSAFLVRIIPSFADDIIENVLQQEISKDFNKQLNCLTNNIYFEAATEPYEGKLAVAQVVLNRANNPNFPSTVCEVVYQRTFTPTHILVCQFSWTCLKNMVVRDKYAWEESEIVARKALTEGIVHDKIAATNAMYYHADYVNPKWNNSKVVAKIGRHIFYAYNKN
jgi:spore germination cell wall hydrolase CwlJ-like protein